MEKRRFSRTSFTATGSITARDTAVDCEVLNLALKGALVVVGEAGTVRVGDSVVLSFRLADKITVVNARGTCVHLDGSEVGIRFTSMDLDSLTHLRRLMELNTADADSIDRELGFLVEE